MLHQLWFVYEQSRADYEYGITVRIGSSVNFEVAMRTATILADVTHRVYIMDLGGEVVWDSLEANNTSG